MGADDRHHGAISLACRRSLVAGPARTNHAPMQHKSSLEFKVMQFHRLASLILGIWLGASVLMDFVATQNFRTVSRVLGSLDVRAVERSEERRLGKESRSR